MMMRAAVLQGPKKVQIRDAATGEPDPGQVQVRLDGCGVCGSDIALWEGRPWFQYPQPPGAPGHEGWGTVEAIGRGVIGLARGDRVAGLFHGAFAEYATTDAQHVIRFPERIRDGPFAGEPLACAANAVRRTNVRAGERIVVLGIGFIGAAIVAFAKAQGAEVLAVSRRPYALDVARRMGADDTALYGQDPVEEHVAEWTDGRHADAVFEVTGRQAPLDLAARLTKVRGRLAIAGYHQDGQRTVDMQLWNWRGLDVINAHERDPDAYMAGMRHAAMLVSDGVVDFSPLYTHTFPLGRIDEAFNMMTQRPDGFLKAVIVP